MMHDLVADGNSVILVDHDTQILKEADWIIEMGPEAGAKGGHVIAEGSIPTIEENPASQIGPFLSGKAETRLRTRAAEKELFANGTIHLSTAQIHTVKPLEVDIPKGRLTVVTGVSGSGKTTMILESLVPALEASVSGSASTRRPSGSMFARLLPPTRVFTTNCESCMQNLLTQRKKAIRQVTFPITPAIFAALAATEQALSVWMFNFCRMSTFPARIVEARAMQELLMM